MSDANERDPRRPEADGLDPGGGPDVEDPELSGIEEAPDEGLIFLDQYRWVFRDEAEEELGVEAVAALAAQQQVEFRAYLRSRRGEAEPADE